MVGPRETVFGLDDLGEAVVRLESIVLFDRRGDVIYLDQFDDGLTHWDSLTVGVGSTVTSSTTTARHGANSIELHNGAVAGAFSTLVGRFPYPVISSLGMEVAFTVHANTQTLMVGIYVHDGVNYNRGHIRYNPTTNILEYYTTLGAWATLVTPLDLHENIHMFHILKLVVNITTQEYVRVIVDANEYAMTGLALNTVLSPVAPMLYVIVDHEGDGANTSDVYIDDFILTQNEPS